MLTAYGKILFNTDLPMTAPPVLHIGRITIQGADTIAALREKLEAAEAQKTKDDVSFLAMQAMACKRIEQRDEARAQAAAAWTAGRDAAEAVAVDRYHDATTDDGCDEADRIADSIKSLTPPADHSEALQQMLDAEHNAALAAVRKGMCIENGSRGDHTLRALSRPGKGETA